jgi:hypothetical protein
MNKPEILSFIEVFNIRISAEFQEVGHCFLCGAALMVFSYEALKYVNLA